MKISLLLLLYKILYRLQEDSYLNIENSHQLNDEIHLTATLYPTTIRLYTTDYFHYTIPISELQTAEHQ
jgi:hypothetical protein